MTESAAVGRHEAGMTSASLPIFQQILGDDWERLGAIIRRHYFLRPFSYDQICVKGTMHDVHHSTFAKLLIPLARIFGALVPYRGKNVPIEVHYTTRPDDATIHWDRIFHFPGRAPFHFLSYMEQIGPGKVIEFVRFGVGMKLHVAAEDGALVFRDEGYIWRLFGVDVPLPMALLMGSAYIEERPVDENRFTMRMTLTHPLFGQFFRYEGSFALPNEMLSSSVPPEGGTSLPR